MGEAKLRSSLLRFKPNYKIGRGLVFPPPVKAINNGSGLESWPIDPNEWNNAILYWDKIAFTENNLIHIGLNGEDVLTKEEILVRVKGEFDYQASLKARIDLEHAFQAGADAEFAALEKRAPGFWCKTAVSQERLKNAPGFEEGRSVLISLIDALPVPPVDTPIDDILEFKLKRKSELARLRDSIDVIYLRVSNNSDEAMALQQAVGEIDKSIADVLKSSKEWWKAISLTDSKSLFNLAAGPVAGAILGSAITLPTAGAIVGGVGSLLNIANGINTRLKANRNSPFWYAAEIKRTLN